METININRVIYQLTIEDLQNVANEVLNRNLTGKEIELLEDKIGDNIDWHETLYNAIIQNIKK